MQKTSSQQRRGHTRHIQTAEVGRERGREEKLIFTLLAEANERLVILSNFVPDGTIASTRGWEIINKTHLCLRFHQNATLAQRCGPVSSNFQFKPIQN